MSEPRLVLRPRMIPDQADPTPLGCDSSAGPAAPLGVLVTVTRAPKFDGRRPTEAAPDALDCRAAAPSTFGREHLVGLDGQSSVSAAGLLRLDRPLPPTRQSLTAPAPSGRQTIVGLEWNPLDALGRALSASNDGPITAPGKLMSVIAKAIADRQSEIERLEAEIKALNEVDKILGTSAPPAKPAARRSSSRRTAAAATPVAETPPAETPPDAKPTRKRRTMSAEEKNAVSERMTAYWAERRKKAAK